MKTKTKLIQLILILTILLTPISKVFGPALNYPNSGEITYGTGGDTWGRPFDDKEDAIPYFMSLANSYGGSYESIGASSANNGWDIVLFKFGNPNGGTVMIDSYLHGNEYYGYQVLKSVITWLLTSNDPESQRILQNNYILVAPVVNYRWGRTNYNSPSWMTATDPGNDGNECGVNLNRNFGPNWPSSSSNVNSDNYSGESADSEPESQALINAWNTYQPLIYWNLHQGIGPSTSCSAISNQAKTDANTVKNILPSIQNSLGVSNGWSFSVSSGYGNGYSKDGAAYRGSAGFLTEVMSGWDATASKKADLETGNTFKQVKAMFIAMCQAVEESSPQTPSEWSITITSSQGGSTSISGTRTVNVGQSLTLTANPNSGNKLDFWILDGVEFSSSRTVTVPSQNSGSAHTIYAQFSEVLSTSLQIASTGLIIDQPTSSSLGVGVNYLSNGNRGDDYTTERLNQDFSYFREHGIGYIDVRIAWTSIEPSQGDYRESMISNFERVILIAHQYDIKVSVSFWTQPAYETTNNFLPSWVPSWYDLFEDTEYREAWLNMVSYVSSRLSDADFFFACNEPYAPSNIRADLTDFLVLTLDALPANTPKSARFIAGWNPFTGYFPDSDRIISRIDFLAVTIYNDPNDEAYQTTSRTSWVDFKNRIDEAKINGLDVWVIEFGKDVDEESQREYYQDCIEQRFIPYDVDVILGWGWQSVGDSIGNWNIAKGVAEGKTAFFELENALD